MKNLTRNNVWWKRYTLFALALLVFCSAFGQSVTIDQSAPAYNTNADQMGIWINSNSDVYEPGYVDLLRSLNVKSIRHGWQYSVMDENNPDQFYRSPCDSDIQFYLGEEQPDGSWSCNLKETMPMSDIGALIHELDVPGYAILGMDGIVYTGGEDPILSGMATIEDREDFYIANAERWVQWSMDNGDVWDYYELGNENDFDNSEMKSNGKGDPWTAAAYATYALKMAKAIKAINPNAKVGINGGLHSNSSIRLSWNANMIAAEPTLNDWIDFYSYHKYEFGTNLTTWQSNLYEYGRIEAGFLPTITNNFPGMPIHVTETSGFKAGDGHYRNVLTVEMLGNMLLDREIEHIQQWGTRWGDILAFDQNSQSLNPMGYAIKAYMDFAKPEMFANGKDGNIRYFASRDPGDNTMSIWMINHSSTDQVFSANIDQFASTLTPEVWTYTSPGNDPQSSESYLELAGTTDVTMNGSTGSVSVTCPGTSITILSFDVSGPPPPPQDPYVVHEVDYGAIIEAEHWDLGGQDVAYNDDNANTGTDQTRAGENVDVFTGASGLYVGDIADGEWLEYNMTTTSGRYDVFFNVATTAGGGNMTIRINGITQGQIPLPNTNGQFQEILWENKNLYPSSKILQVEFEGNNTVQFDNLRFEETTVAECGPVLNGWTSTDIGTSQGTSSWCDFTWTLEGWGQDISNTSDQFQYTHTPFDGDGEISARVTAVENIDTWTKAGIMFRSSTATDAANVLVFQRPDNQVAMQWRSANGGGTSTTALAGGVSSIKYVKITKTGNNYEGFYSTSGEEGSWLSLGSVGIDMGANMLAGLAVTSHNAWHGNIATAVFDNVNIGDPPAPTPPTYASAKTSIDGTNVQVTFSKNVVVSESGAAGFAVSVNGSNVAISGNAHTGKVVTLNLANAIADENDVVLVSYTPGTVQSTAGALVEAFAGYSVVNFVGYVPPAADFTADFNQVLNSHADQVGTWVNTNADVKRPSYVQALRDMKTKSIRHGWQYAIMDENDPDVFHASPFDPQIQSYITNGNGVINEIMKLSEVSDLATELDVPGWAILSMDGINYTASSDQQLANMTKAEREQFYIDNAVRWANWAKDNNFKYFEIGNENDLADGEMVAQGRGTLWDPVEYGRVYKLMAQAIKAVDPSIKCGLNGGWMTDSIQRTNWWDGIAQGGGADINDYVDFLVIHKYESWMGYDIWNENAWPYGQIHSDNFSAFERNFPDTPLHITEMSGFKAQAESNIQHYRAVLTVEMLGNMLTNPLIEHVHHWGTRWANLGISLKPGSDELDVHGNAIKAYMDFAKPVMFANGLAGTSRYFAAKDPSNNSTTVWFINRSEADTVINFGIENYLGDLDGDVWALTSAGNNPAATSNSFAFVEPITAVMEDGMATFSITLSPSSATVVTFGEASTPDPNLPPTVSLTSPEEGDDFVNGADITLTATASDSDGTVSSVKFYRGGTLIGEDTDAPYSVVWSGAAGGSYALTAVATDDDNASTTSSVINITVAGPPTYTLTVNNGSGDGDYEEGEIVEITADAPAAGQYFSGWTGDVSALVDQNASTTNVTMGTAAITVTANYATIPTYTLVVNNGSGDGDYEAGEVVNISADAAPSGQQFAAWTGDVSGVENVNSSNTTFTMSAAAATITATYEDIPSNVNIALGKTASQASTYPGGGASKAVDGNTNGNWGNNSVTHTNCGSNDWWRVNLGGAFTIGDIKIYNRTDCCSERLDDYNVKVLDASLNTVWTNFQSEPAGSPTVVNAGGITGYYVEIQKTTAGCLSIAEVEVFGNGGTPPPVNQAPTVSLTSPANNTTFTEGDAITISASASDSDGSVTKVEFYQGATKLGEDTSAPYSYTWNGAGVGSYSLTAKATDDDNAQTTSSAISITVEEDTPPVGGDAYRYLKLTGHSKVQNGVQMERIDWLVGSDTYPNPRITNATSSTVSSQPYKQYAWHAYNNNGQAWAPLDDVPASITIDLGIGNEIAPTGIKLDASHTQRGFGSFTCYGSNDGVNFVELATFSGLTAADYPNSVGTFSFGSSSRIGQETDVESLTSESISLFPNPVRDYFTIEGINESFSIKVFDLSGTMVLEKINVTSKDQIDISKVKRGIYFVNILDANANRSSIKIIKQ